MVRQKDELGWLFVTIFDVTICLHDVESHFAKKDPAVRATYRRVLEAARALGPVTEDAKKTSIL